MKQMNKIDWSDHKPIHFIFNKAGWIVNWFSNMTECNLEFPEYPGIVFRSVENYYQAMKTDNIDQIKVIAQLEPHYVKKIGKLFLLIENWDDIKPDIMKKALRMKFSQEIWQRKLLQTGILPIIEWNNWGDSYWGVPVKDCKGHNILGIFLMDIRNEIKTNQTK
jgi:ribA/ribD-fused uncharacterized protein